QPADRQTAHSGTIASFLSRYLARRKREQSVEQERRRVVVTGIGALTPLADTIDTTWQRLLAGESGISRIERWDTSEYPVKIAGEIKETPELPWLDSK